VQQLAGNYSNYAAGEAMRGAGEGMAKGGANAGVAGLGAQMAMGVGMANNMMAGQMGMMQPQFPVGGPAAPAAAAAPAASVEDRLVKLKSLKDKGLISDDDFAKKRDAILAEI
jgi:membrane protease subunit (stomatin/prohibitin family)